MTIDLAADTLAMLTDFGERIVYRPADGMPREITAIVTRRPRELMDDVGVLLPKLSIIVANHPQLGISSAQLDTGRDRVDVAERCGGPVVTRMVGEIVGEHDEGMIELEVR